MEKYDVAVIGSGPGGFSAAMRAIDFGKKVCLIEAGHLGGAGIMNGALTSKAMWELSKDYSMAARVDRGYRSSGLSVSYKEVLSSVKQAAKQARLQMLSQIETFSEPKNEAGGTVVLKYGHARFVDKHTLSITHNEEEELIQATNIVIATGSRPRSLPGVEIDHKNIITSDDIMKLKDFPEKMLIIGSGIIGCEFATIFSNYGQTEVHLLDRQKRVIPFEDDDISKAISNSLENNGVIIHHTASLGTIRKKKDYLEVVLDFEDGHCDVLEVDIALISIGRQPNSDDLGLENVGIKPTERGELDITRHCALDDFKNCHIFAVGDVSVEGLKLYNAAELQGRHVIEALYSDEKMPLDYSNMATLMFFRPLVASVGLNEKMCQERGIAYRVATYSNELVNRSIAMRSKGGFVKILVSDDGNDRILGMRAIGPQASSFITSIAYLINQYSSLKDANQGIYPHPSITEGIQECLRVFENKSVLKPEAFPHLISYRTWKPSK
ncbi:dihydrolipoamide dehydrogenase [Balneicella halophila]|uniref:Dihydrolipoamide dehydrogenase n=1 Tax=Balneicella halophila TaxID=1537566 RepID=A0A7L4UQI6_BALHA|nr:NAD(P)/FAD-dependent oxidoreductase [Balneicella halophila]PVX51076.1 dihydrolipoamide dehydrogenase [Balneicella halophila]